MAAAVQLMQASGAIVHGCVVVIELVDLHGRDKVLAKTISLIPING